MRFLKVELPPNYLHTWLTEQFCNQPGGIDINIIIICTKVVHINCCPILRPVAELQEFSRDVALTSKTKT